jgi:hypothetical protein
MGRALFGLSLGKLEKWPGSAEPVFESVVSWSVPGGLGGIFPG